MLTANLEKVRQNLAFKHAETVRESERQMRMKQQERQAVFQDAFQSDMKYYKEIGKIPSKIPFQYSIFDLFEYFSPFFLYFL